EIPFAQYRGLLEGSPDLANIYVPALGGEEIGHLFELSVAPRAVDPNRCDALAGEGDRMRFQRSRYEHSRPAKALYEQLAGSAMAIACQETAVHLAVTLVPTADVLLKHKLIVFPNANWVMFGVLQSAAHVEWAWRWGLRRAAGLVYSPKRCARTFP